MTTPISSAMVAELVALFKSEFGNKAECAEFPDKPNPKKGFTHPKAAIWVGYAGSGWASPESLGTPLQLRELRFDVSVLTRDLNGGTGSSAYLESVINLTHGLRLERGGAPMFILRDGFEAYGDGIWRYSVTLATRVPRMPDDVNGDAAGETTLPRLKRGTFVDEFDESSVVEVP
jgi:hypothetical protein